MGCGLPYGLVSATLTSTFLLMSVYTVVGRNVSYGSYMNSLGMQRLPCKWRNRPHKHLNLHALLEPHSSCMSLEYPKVYMYVYIYRERKPYIYISIYIMCMYMYMYMYVVLYIYACVYIHTHPYWRHHLSLVNIPSAL